MFAVLHDKQNALVLSNKLLAEHGYYIEDNQDNLGEPYVLLHGEKIFERRIVSYKNFYNPILAVVQADMMTE